MPAQLDTIVSHLDSHLKISAIPDYPGALNGLQLRSEKPVKKVIAAVDAALPVIEQAVAEKADLLLVHHGLFWGGAQRIDGPVYEKLKLAMDAGLAIYSSHIPLDVHPRLGNCALLAKAIGLTKPEAFFEWKGILLGQKFTTQLRRDALLKKIEKAVGGPVHLAPGGPKTTGKIGIITGGAGSEVAAAAACGIDTFITGEGPHHTYTLAEELGVNLIYAGHYATETFGVRKLAEHLAKKYKLKHAFVDHPTGL